MIEYHRDKLGYSAEDLAKLLAVSAADIQAAYFERPSLRLVVSN